MLQKHIAGRPEFDFELPAGDIGRVEHVVGRSVADYSGETRQGVTTCKVSGQFDRRGLSIFFSGDLDYEAEIDLALHSEHYQVRAFIEWRVLRFLFDIYFVEAMYSRIVEASGDPSTR